MGKSSSLKVVLLPSRCVTYLYHVILLTRILLLQDSAKNGSLGEEEVMLEWILILGRFVSDCFVAIHF